MKNGIQLLRCGGHRVSDRADVLAQIIVGRQTSLLEADERISMFLDVAETLTTVTNGEENLLRGAASTSIYLSQSAAHGGWMWNSIYVALPDELNPETATDSVHHLAKGDQLWAPQV